MPETHVVIPTHPGREWQTLRAVRSAFRAGANYVVVVHDGRYRSMAEWWDVTTDLFSGSMLHFDTPGYGHPSVLRNDGLWRLSRLVPHEEYVTWLDSDDIMAPSRITEASALLDAGAEIAIGHQMAYLDPGEELPSWINPHDLTHSHPYVTSAVAPLSFWLEHFWPEDMEVLDDVAWAERTLPGLSDVAQVDSVWTYRTIHQNQLTANRAAVERDLEMLYGPRKAS